MAVENQGRGSGVGSAEYEIAPAPAPIGDEVEREVQPSTFDEISKAETTVDALNRRLYDSRRLSQAETDAVKSTLTAWASSIPHHAISSFGDQIEVLEAAVSPPVMVRVATIYESRTVSKRSQPFRGQAVAAPKTSESNIRPWNFPLPAPGDYAPSERSYLISDSQVVRDCQGCAGEGFIACLTCSGKGKLRCAPCAGSGRVSCRGCSGRGKVSRTVTTQRHENFTEYRTVVKYDMNGRPHHEREPYNAIRVRDFSTTYQDTCPACGGCGAVDCWNCRGTGNVSCTDCEASGRHMCSNCSGSGRISEFLLITDSFRPNELVSFRENPLLPVEPTSQLDADGDFRLIASIRGKTISSAHFERLDSAPLRSALKSALDDALRNAVPGERIRSQTVQILRSDAIAARYRFDGREYDVFLLGRDRRVIAPFSPIARITRELAHNATAMLDSSDPLPGLEHLLRTIQMKQQKERVSSILASFRVKLAESHAGVAALLSDDGRWLDSLYHSDRANSLFPNGRLGDPNAKMVRSRIFLLYLGPAAAVMAAGILAGLVTGKALILLAALSAGTCGIASLYGAGTFLRRNIHAILISTAASAVTLITAATAFLTGHTLFASLESLAAPAVVWGALYLAARQAQPPPPPRSGEDQAEAIVRDLQAQIAVEWPYIQDEFAKLPPLSTYAGRWRDATGTISDRQERRAAAVADAMLKHDEQLSIFVEDASKLFNRIENRLHDFQIAVHRGDVRGVTAIGRDIQNLGRGLGQALARIERAAKKRGRQLRVSHAPGDDERVVLDLSPRSPQLVEAVRRIRPFAEALAGMQKQPAASLRRAGGLHAAASAGFEIARGSGSAPDPRSAPG